MSTTDFRCVSVDLVRWPLSLRWVTPLDESITRMGSGYGLVCQARMQALTLGMPSSEGLTMLVSVCWCCAYTLSIAASCKSVQQQYTLGASHQLFLTSSVWVTSLGFLGSVLSLWSNKNPSSLQLRRIAFRRLHAGGIEAETIMASALLSACPMRVSASTGARLPPCYLVSCSSTPTTCVAAPKVLWPQSHVWIVSRIGIFFVLLLVLVHQTGRVKMPKPAPSC
jgi:hypothetical protein